MAEGSGSFLGCATRVGVGYLLLTPWAVQAYLKNPSGFLAFIVCTLGIGPAYVIVALFPVALLLGFVACFLGDLVTRRKATSGEGETQLGTGQRATRQSKDRKILGLRTFIDSSRKAGYSDDRIARDLKIGGWSEEEIRNAFAFSRDCFPC